MPCTELDDFRCRRIEGRYKIAKVMRGAHPINNVLAIGLVTYLKGIIFYGFHIAEKRRSRVENQIVLFKNLQRVRVMDPPWCGFGRLGEGSTTSQTHDRGNRDAKRGRSRATWAHLQA